MYFYWISFNSQYTIQELDLTKCSGSLTEITECQCQDPDGYSVWPLVTPVMGNISSGCCEASRQYITLLGEALSAPLTVTDKQRAALKMLDSNGPLPFLQEGMLQVMTIDDGRF